MNEPFTITLKVHHDCPDEPSENTREETILHSDGRVLVRQYDHHGPDGHYRLVRRAVGHTEAETVPELRSALLQLICQSAEFHPADTPDDAEVLLTQPGLKLSADGRLFDGTRTCASLIQDVLENLSLEWNPVTR